MPTKPLLVLAFLSLLVACSKNQRTEAFLPPADVQGDSSSSFSLYASGSEEATLAMGQIFLPPKGHTLLLKVGFLCRNATGSFHPALDAYVKLRISRWTGDRPASTPLWVSEAVLVKRDINGWLNFDVPHVELVPDQKYVAWITMLEIQNAEDASFSVVAMGPRTSTPRKPNEPWQPTSWTSDYPDGFRIFWRGNNPERRIDVMTQSSWITESYGQNLHFKMAFESRKLAEK